MIGPLRLHVLLSWTINRRISQLITLGVRAIRPPILYQFALANIDALAQVDLLALDIADVVPEDPKRGGLQLIKKTKQLPNAPIVIAVSVKD